MQSSSQGRSTWAGGARQEEGASRVRGLVSYSALAIIVSNISIQIFLVAKIIHS
jgi:hypothetical protein